MAKRLRGVKRAGNWGRDGDVDRALQSVMFFGVQPSNANSRAVEIDTSCSAAWNPEPHRGAPQCNCVGGRGEIEANRPPRSVPRSPGNRTGSKMP
eukprot:6801112-Pyramimonas_sp.AAC.1